MNEITIAGRLGADPELKTAKNGKEYTNISVAVDRAYKGKDEERITDWFHCAAFEKTAVYIARYYHKGDGVLIHGRMENDRYKDKDGNNRDSWKLKIEHLEFPPRRSSGNDATGQPAEAPVEGFTPVNEDEIPF